MTGDTGDAFLPYGRQSVDEEDIAAVAEVLRGDWLTTGPAVERFETALAAQTDARHAIACSSGTAALHMASLALGLSPGDRVIVPSVTFLATANAPRHAGAEIVFADVGPDSGLMGVRELVAALLRAQGVERALIGGGQSSYVAIGSPRGESGWLVGLRSVASADEVVSLMKGGGSGRVQR